MENFALNIPRILQPPIPTSMFRVSVCVCVWTYRECVCAIVLPHLQQSHHHFMEFISRQNPITVHIKHFEANCQRNRAM